MKRLLVCALFPFAALAYPPPKIPQEPPADSVPRAVVERAAAKGLPIAQWLLMRWYGDHQGLIKYDPSDEAINTFLGMGGYCAGTAGRMSLREGLELLVVGAPGMHGFVYHFSIEHERHERGDLIIVHENLDAASNVAVLERPRRYVYELGVAKAVLVGAQARLPDGSWRKAVIDHGPLETMGRQFYAYCGRRFSYRQAAIEWVKKQQRATR